MEKKGQEVQTPKRFYEPKTTPMQDVCEWKVDEDGHHIYVKVGEKNLDDEIQLYKDSCDIKILVDKMMKGDAQTIALLNRPVSYGDVNDFPQEYHPVAGAQALHQLYENQFADKFDTYEAFEKFYINLTDAMIAEMNAPKEEVKKEEVVNE